MRKYLPLILTLLTGCATQLKYDDAYYKDLERRNTIKNFSPTQRSAYQSSFLYRGWDSMPREKDPTAPNSSP